MLTGQCLCGGIEFTLERAAPIVFCHCKQCRSAQGTPFASNFPVPKSSFQISRGEALLTFFQSSSDKRRYFCKRCGSSIYSQRSDSDSLRIRAGLIVEFDGVKPIAHIYAGEAPAWAMIYDDLPRHHGVEPGRK